MRKLLAIVGLLLICLPSFAADCAQHFVTLKAAEKRMYARSISSNLAKWQPPAGIRIERALRIGNWTAVWATPRDMEQGVFFYSEEKSGVTFHDVWGGMAQPEDRANIEQWVRKLAPAVPADLPACFADAVIGAR